MPTRATIITAAAAAAVALSVDSAAAAAVWVPTLADGKNNACGNAYKHGGTLLAQCGAPTTSQIAVNAEVLKRKDGSDNGLECVTDENGARVINPDFEPKLTGSNCPNDGYTNQVPAEFIAITDHSISLVPKTGFSDNNRISAIEKQWPGAWSGMGSTNWGGTSGNALAQAYNVRIGDQANNGQGDSAPKSTLGQGYISYFFKNSYEKTTKDTTGDAKSATFELAQNQFFLGMPGNINQYVNGCPNKKPGETFSSSNGDKCPEKTVKPGDYKFSILGTLSGTMINSGASDFAAGTQSFSTPNSGTYRDMAKYTTMLYRNTLDVGTIKSDMKVVLQDGTERPFSDFDAPDNGIDISGSKIKIGSLDVVFEPNLSMGKYELTKQDISTDLPGGNYPCNSNNMDDCTLDYTGYFDSPHSFPLGANLGVKKIGKGCRSTAECDAWKEFMDTQNQNADKAKKSYAGCTECESGDKATILKDLPGALKLDVSEVVKMKITMRKSKGCEARPNQPDGHDEFGNTGASWTKLPADHDCPWWYLATKNNNEWAADEDRIPGGYKSLTTCGFGSADCYLIDFHIPLEIDGKRTALGDVQNDYDLGWQKGSFFMYDPEVNTPPLPTGQEKGQEKGEEKGQAGLSQGASIVVATVVAAVVAALT
jgi:hypothetical protein